MRPFSPRAGDFGLPDFVVFFAQWQSLEYAEPVAYLPSEQTLASCRGNIGFPSTRELGALGKALGV